MSVLKVCVQVCKRGENPQACQSCQPVSDYGTHGDSYSCPEMDSREETWDMNNLFWTKYMHVTLLDLPFFHLV